LLLSEIDNYLPAEFVSGREALPLMPLYELIEELFRIFEMEKIENQDAYLFSFYDAVVEYLQNNSSDPDSFITFWEERLCGKTIPSGEIEGIRIMSIHKSKGLSFTPCCFRSATGNWKTKRIISWCGAHPPYRHSTSSIWFR